MGKGGAIVSGPRKGALGMALQILGREGVHGFYSGLSAGVVRHVLYTGGLTLCAVTRFAPVAAMNAGARRGACVREGMW